MLNKLRFVAVVSSVSMALLLSAGDASAQATRTWVSGVGDDANPCSRTAPCKTFAGAISKTAAGGEISVLDPGGFGAVTITKSISLISEGSEGSILACGTNGIVINAGVNDVINIHGLFIEGCGGTASVGLNGIRILQAGSVYIRNTLIRGFTTASPNGFGLNVAPTSAPVSVYVSDSALAKNSGGILVKTTGAILARVHLDRVTVAQNSGAGITTDGANAIVRMNQSTVTFNATGLATLNGGDIISFGNNAIISNGAGETPTSTIALK